MYAAAAAGVVLIAAIGLYFAWPSGLFGTRPKDADVQAALAAQLPAFMRLDRMSTIDIERGAVQDPPTFNVRFAGAATLTSTVFLRATPIDDAVIFLGQPTREGTQVDVSGQAVLRRVDDRWTSEVTIESQPLLDAAPAEAFAGRRLFVEGTPEAEAYIAQRENDRRMSDQLAALQSDRAEQQRQLEIAQREQQQLALRAAKAEQARLEAERKAAVEAAARKRVDDEERVRAAIAAEEDRLRAEAAERNRILEEARRRNELSRRATATGLVPKNTEFSARIDRPLRSDVVQVEDRFEATTTEDIMVGGQILVPAGSVLRGIIAAVKPATRTSRTASMDLRFDQLVIGADAIPLRARVTKVINGPGLKGDAVKAGVAAGIGAVLGGILGGAKGAAIGGAAGAGGTMAVTEGKEIDLQPGSVLRVKLDAPVEIR